MLFKRILTQEITNCVRPNQSLKLTEQNGAWISPPRRRNWVIIEAYTPRSWNSVRVVNAPNISSPQLSSGPLGGSQFHVKRFEIIVAFTLPACQQMVDPPYMPSYSFSGSVLDSTTSAPIISTLIGFKDSTIADTVLFRGDSVNLPPRNSMIYLYSVSQGGFQFIQPVRDTTSFKFLFAYKTGYRLWRFHRQPLATRRVTNTSDQITIMLSTK